MLANIMRTSLKRVTQPRIMMKSQRTFATSRELHYQLIQLDEMRQELRKTVEKFASDEVEPLDDEMDRTNVFPKHLWRKMGDLGLLGITVEEEYGGAGLGYFEQCLITEELSKASGSVGISYLAHSNLCINQIRLNASDV